MVGLVGGFVLGFGMFGVPEPSAEFQEPATFQVINAGINVALFGGLILLIFGAVRSARPGSWWRTDTVVHYHLRHLHSRYITETHSADPPITAAMSGDRCNTFDESGVSRCGGV